MNAILIGFSGHQDMLVSIFGSSKETPPAAAAKPSAADVKAFFARQNAMRPPGVSKSAR